MKLYWTRPFISLILSGCATTYVVPPDPIPVIGAQVMTGAALCLDVRDGVTADGTPIVLFQCQGSPNQRWFISHGQISENFGSCLDVQGSAGIEGSPIILVTCSGSPSQQWRLAAGQIIGIGGKCVEPSGSGGAIDLTPLALADCKTIWGDTWTVR